MPQRFIKNRSWNKFNIKERSDNFIMKIAFGYRAVDLDFSSYDLLPNGNEAWPVWRSSLPKRTFVKRERSVIQWHHLPHSILTKGCTWYEGERKFARNLTSCIQFNNKQGWLILGMTLSSELVLLISFVNPPLPIYLSTFAKDDKRTEQFLEKMTADGLFSEDCYLVLRWIMP